MENIFKGSKRVIATILTLGILFGIAGTCVYAVSEMSEVNTVAIDEFAQELIPMKAYNCNRNHYEVTASWPNGNVKTVTYYLVDAQGNQVGDEIWTANYPETGAGSMGAYGTPGGFKGCNCPNCGG